VSDLLTIEEIADLWKVSRDYAQRYLVKKPDFPRPAPGSTRKKPRWRALDVQEFIGAEEAA
jgi:predicted DNA-binding transcriptional regulator AlpA